MWKKFLSLFGIGPVVEIEPEQVDVGKGLIYVKMKNGEEFKLIVEGSLIMGGTDWASIIHASDRFSSWQERAGKTGMISIGNDRFRPVADVADISVKYSTHMVEDK